MSERNRFASRLLGLLGSAGLAAAICAPPVSAAPPVPPFGNANYAGRYVCNVISNEPGFNAGQNPTPQFFSGVMILAPNGNGTFSQGLLRGAASAINGVSFDSTLPPVKNFCTYTLDTAHSTYTVYAGGALIEVLRWTVSTAGAAGCNGSFVMSDTSVLPQSGLNSDNTASASNSTSNNLFGADAEGQGYCEQ